MKIIGLSGKIGSGKSTFAAILKELLREEGYIVEERNFADKLKKICFELTGVYGYTQEEKNIYIADYDKNVGEILQQIGTEALRNNFDKDVWVKSTLRALNPNVYYIIGDLRFENEAEILRSRGALLVRLNGDPAKVRENSGRDLNHISETALDNYAHFDFVYQNDKGLDELKEFAQTILKYKK